MASRPSAARIFTGLLRRASRPLRHVRGAAILCRLRTLRHRAERAPLRGRDLGVAVRYADLELLRAGLLAEPRARDRDRTKAPSPDHDFSGAVLFAAHGSSLAIARLETTAPGARPRLVRAAVDRLLAERRTQHAWTVVRARPDVRYPASTLRGLATILTEPAALEDLRSTCRSLPGLSDGARDALDALVSLRLGATHLRRRHHAQALSEFERAESVRPSAATAVGLAALALDRGDTDTAERLVSTALQREPGHRPAVLLRARLARVAGDDGDARRAWMQVVRSSAATVDEILESWDGLGRIGEHEDQLAAAEALIRRVGDRPAGRAARAVALWHLGQRDVAEEAVSELGRDLDAVALRSLALFLGRTGRSVEAYEALGRLTLQVRGARASAELVRGLSGDGHVRLARQAADRALRAFGEDPELMDARDQAMSTDLPPMDSRSVAAS